MAITIKLGATGSEVELPKGYRLNKYQDKRVTEFELITGDRKYQALRKKWNFTITWDQYLTDTNITTLTAIYVIADTLNLQVGVDGTTSEYEVSWVSPLPQEDIGHGTQLWTSGIELREV